MFSERMLGVTGSATLKVGADAEQLRRQGIDLVDFGQGEPDFATPAHIKDAARRALDDDFTKYTPASGVLELREAVCRRYHDDYGVAYTPAQVQITAGGKQALFNAATVLFGPGDEVITHAPYWPSIVEQARLCGARPVIVRSHSDHAFDLDAERMLAAITPRTKAIVINSPCNPTGAIIREHAIEALAVEAGRRDVWLIADLCYERLVYDGAWRNIPRVLATHAPERAVIAGSCSKTYAMTGWRCGWVIGPKALVDACNTVQGHSTSNVTSITQKAAIAALAGPQDCVATMLAEYERRRDLALGLFTRVPGVVCARPSGAFYLLLDIRALLSTGSISTSAAYASALLYDAHVVVTPGEAFDAPGYLRISYTTSRERIEEGADRFLHFVEGRRSTSDAAAGMDGERAG
jgi:aspartate aminotransferase